MQDDTVNRGIRSRRVATALVVAALPFAGLDMPTAFAQAMNVMRTPNLNIDTRMPTINPTVAPRIDPNIAGRTVTSVDRVAPTITPTTAMRIQRVNPNSTMPYARYSP